MSIILDGNTKILVQGITGKESSFWTEKMLQSGTNIAAGVTPGKGGSEVHGVPVYDLVEEAVAEGPIDMAVLYVPARFTRDALFEVLAAGIKKAVALADGVPVYDMLEIKELAKKYEAMIIGPNTPGMATLGEAMVGFIPVWLSDVYRPGSVGLITRSGTLTNEISSHIIEAGYGISTLVGCGGDSLPGTRFTDLMPLFAEDEQTEALVIVGEIGGSMEEEVAEFVKGTGFAKPVVAYVAGRTAPKGKRMGHAGAIISRGKGTVEGKRQALESAGIPVAATPAEVGSLLRRRLG
jgi:succinyl-CoA synthetase alpha subunit